jgi:hypothetical protein
VYEYELLRSAMDDPTNPTAPPEFQEDASPDALQPNYCNCWGEFVCDFCAHEGIDFVSWEGLLEAFALPIITFKDFANVCVRECYLQTLLLCTMKARQQAIIQLQKQRQMWLGSKSPISFLEDSMKLVDQTQPVQPLSELIHLVSSLKSTPRLKEEASSWAMVHLLTYTLSKF